MPLGLPRRSPAFLWLWLALVGPGLAACADPGRGEIARAVDALEPLDGGADIPSGPGDADVAPGRNRPPRLARIGEKVAAVGATLTIVLRATDPDGDPLVFDVLGERPKGALLDQAAGRFTLVPDVAQLGRTLHVTFVVSDGLAFDRETVRIVVAAEALPHPPQFEPLGDQNAVAGQPIEFTLEATDPDGDALTFAFAAAPPGGAELDGATGHFSWTPAFDLAGRVVRFEFTASDGGLQATLALNVVVAGGRGATNRPPSIDPLEPFEASVGSPLTFVLTASDPDGDGVVVTTYGSLPEGARFDPLALTFHWTPGPLDGGRAVAVTFQASDGELVAYAVVEIDVAAAPPRAGCAADAFEPNDSPSAAATLSLADLQMGFADLHVCAGDNDFFTVALLTGQSLAARIVFDGGQADLDFVLLTSDLTVVAESTGVADEEVVAVGPVAAAATYTLHVYPYSIEVEDVRYALEAASCDPLSCPPQRVCDGAAGRCVEDYCAAAAACPAGYDCIDTYCVDPCAAPADCRAGYACKPLPAGPHCAASGSGAAGSRCTTFADCSGPALCLFPESGGYCAVVDCQFAADCPAAAACVQRIDGRFCAVSCWEDTDCEPGAGHTCQPAHDPAGETVWVCLP